MWHVLFLPSDLWLLLCENIKLGPSTVILWPCGDKHEKESQHLKMAKLKDGKILQHWWPWWATKLTNPRPALPWDLLFDISLYCLSVESTFLLLVIKAFFTGSPSSCYLFVSFMKLVKIPYHLFLCVLVFLCIHQPPFNPECKLHEDRGPLHLLHHLSPMSSVTQEAFKICVKWRKRDAFL